MFKPDAYLRRWLSRPDVTMGSFLWGFDPVCLMLENPWLDNTPFKSCIPAGDYECIFREAWNDNIRKLLIDTWGVPFTYEITNVVRRSGILVHPGCEEKDTDGCPLTGSKAKGNKVEESREAFRYFMDVLDRRPKFNLRVEILKPVQI